MTFLSTVRKKRLEQDPEIIYPEKGGNVAEWLELWKNNSEALSSSSTLTASYLFSVAQVQIFRHACKIYPLPVGILNHYIFFYYLLHYP